MTTTTITPTLERPQRSEFSWAVADTKTIAWRNLVTLTRLPQLLVFATIQPVIFVLMFRYVFGGAIQGSLPSAARRVKHPHGCRGHPYAERQPE